MSVAKIDRYAGLSQACSSQQGNDNESQLNQDISAARSTPSKRKFESDHRKADSGLELSDEDEYDDVPAGRPSKRGRGCSGQADQNVIPCVCYMSGKSDYKRCVRKHKYLSHLARHLHRHDIYICQMCFTKFQDHGKEENARQKKEHHCMQACADGSCKRHVLAGEQDKASKATCEHLTTWQERWRELFRTIYPNRAMPELEQSMPKLDFRAPRLKQVSIKSQDVSLSGTYHETKFRRPDVPTTAPSQASTYGTSSQYVSPQISAQQRGHSQSSLPMLQLPSANTAVPGLPSGNESYTQETGLGVVEIAAAASYQDDNQHWAGDSFATTTLQVNIQEVEVQMLKHRVETLEGALRRSMEREEERQLEITAMRKEFRAWKDRSKS